MVVTGPTPELVQQKLAAFASMQAEFEQGFHFQQDVHGQKRFSSFPVGRIVSYLHALWLCERKDRLLSVYKNIRRYDGVHCLELLRDWQSGTNAPVVAFLLQKLDRPSFAELTARIEEARREQADESMARRLEQGRLVLLHRAMNLMHALEAIFSLSERDLLNEVRPACEQYGHTPALIEQQLAELHSPLYTYRPHRLLARCNMVLMNRMEVTAPAHRAKLPAEGSARAQSSAHPLAPFADHVIAGYLPLFAPIHNNLRRVRFIDCAGPEVGPPREGSDRQAALPAERAAEHPTRPGAADR